MKRQCYNLLLRLILLMLFFVQFIITTYAQNNINLTSDGEGGYYVCMPVTGTSNLTLSNANVSSFKLYDDGGASGNYSERCYGTLTIIAPEGFTIGLSGSVTLYNPQDPSGGLVIIYDGTDRDANILTQTTKDIGSIISSENSMTVFFQGGIPDKGLDLTVTLNAPTPHNVTIADNITHGTIVSNKNQAYYNESVALTITPDEGYIINYVKVTDEKNRSIYVTGGRWYNSSTTAQFNMPSQNVTVTPVFIATNNMTASNGLEFDISQAQNGRITLPENVASVLMPRQQPLTVVLIGSGAKLAFNGRVSGTGGTVAYLKIYDGEIGKDEYELFYWIISPQDIAVESTSNVLYFSGTVQPKKFITGTLTQIYSINLDYNNGGSGYYKEEYTCETPTFTLYNPNKNGYEFIGWSGTGLDAITKTITITQGSYGNRSYTANWAKIITEDNLTIEPSTYTGSPLTPIVKCDATTLELGTDYEITLPEGYYTNVGDYTATITGKGNYTGTVEKTFTINAKSLAASNVSDIPAQTYTGSAITPTVTVKDGSKTLTLNTDYSVSYSNNTNAGTAKAKITGLGNYTGSIEKNFTILPAPVTVTAEDKTKTFGESDPEFTATVTGLVNNESPDLITYTLTRTEGENAGEYTITAKGDEKQGNYVVSFVDGKLTINAEPEPENPENIETATEGIVINSDIKIWSFEKTIFVENATKEIVVVDAVGRIVKTVKPVSDRTEIQFNKGGVYIVKSGIKTQKLIIQ